MQTTDVMLQTLRTQPIGLGALPLITSLQRIGGGYETDVYRTEDERYVVKLKRTGYQSARMAYAQAQLLQAIADHFAKCLGAEHSLPNTFAVARDHLGNTQVVTIQPFLKDARPLYTVDYPSLPLPHRHHLMAQLHTIIARAQVCYRTTGLVPDLYGVSGATPGELARLRAPYMIPLHLWDFFMTRTLLRSHNLLLTSDHRVVLVDYDLVMLHKPHLLRRIYFAFRSILFWRDLAEIRAHSST